MVFRVMLNLAAEMTSDVFVQHLASGGNMLAGGSMTRGSEAQEARMHFHYTECWFHYQGGCAEYVWECSYLAQKQ